MNKKIPRSQRCYYIRTMAVRGVMSEDHGFMMDPGAEQLEVSLLLAVEASKNLKNWERLLAMAGKALYKGFKERGKK